MNVVENCNVDYDALIQKVSIEEPLKKVRIEEPPPRTSSFTLKDLEEVNDLEDKCLRWLSGLSLKFSMVCLTPQFKLVLPQQIVIRVLIGRASQRICGCQSYKLRVCGVTLNWVETHQSGSCHFLMELWCATRSYRCHLLMYFNLFGFNKSVCLLRFSIWSAGYNHLAGAELLEAAETSVAKTPGQKNASPPERRQKKVGFKVTKTAQPLDLETAKRLRKLIFGPTYSRNFNDPWLKQAFTFRDCLDDRTERLRYGIIQKKGGPCGLVAIVQVRPISSSCVVLAGFDLHFPGFGFEALNFWESRQ